MDAQIIKGAQRGAPPVLPTTGIVSRKAQEAYAHCELILEAAGAEAAAILENARRQAQADRERARAEGYREGLAHWTEAVLRVTEARDSSLRDCERQLIELATSVARKIIGAELSLDPASIVAIVRQALSGVRREKSLTIEVHPSHLEAIRAKLKALAEAIGGARDLHVAADSSVEPGGCVVQTEFGVIDARLDVQLEVLRECLLRVSRK